jgi:predicted TIM-barrel fold metal-dependent hydrolase
MSASGRYGPIRVNEGIVGRVELGRGSKVGDALEAHVRAGSGRLKSIRECGSWDDSSDIPRAHTAPPKGLYESRGFREGYALLERFGLSFDALQLHPKNISALAKRSNVWVKLGGLGVPIGPFDFHQRAEKPSSAELAEAWGPYIETCIAAFGAERAMFESNFPVDGLSCSYRNIWNAFKRIAKSASASEKALLFRDTARRFYRLS